MASSLEAVTRTDEAIRKDRVSEVEGGTVKRGSVRSLREREQAERVAWTAPGTVRVENYITVTS